MAGAPNVFGRLHKWAWRQDENFLTESLAVVLEQLLILAPAVGTRMLHRLTGGFIDVSPADAGSIALDTQVETGQGRPDLEVCVPKRLAWVEVKVESDLRAGQLEGYRVLLAESGFAHTRLVLLTRYAVEIAADATSPDLAIRWFELADWLEAELPVVAAASEVAFFLLQQFLAFLEERDMTLAQVGKYMPEGLRDLSRLLNMLYEAALSCKVTVKKAPGWDAIGLNLDGMKFFVGIDFDEPEKLCFSTRCRIDREAAVQLGVGKLGEANWVPGKHRWMYSVELDSEEIHFYSRTKVRQFQWLEAFLRDCLAKARSIETPDQPPLPDDPEGS